MVFKVNNGWQGRMGTKHLHLQPARKRACVPVSRESLVIALFSARA